MNKIQRNRIVAIGIVLLLCAAIAGVQYFGVFDFRTLIASQQEGGFDPIAAGDRIEAAAPYMDVLHIGVVESLFLGNPVFHVAVQFYPVPNPYSVEMTDTGWRILAAGEYTWEPGQDESTYDKWHLWTEEKFEYYSENALWAPGKFEWVFPAIEYLTSWHMEKLETQFLLAVYEEAYRLEEDWVAIEISFLGVSKPEMTPGIDASGKPGYVYKMDVILGAIELQWKKLQNTPEGEGYWMADAVERGEFTVDEYRELREVGTIEVAPGWSPWFGMIPYTYGFNHPWQARNVPS